jgi:hypothetical protein
VNHEIHFPVEYLEACDEWHATLSSKSKNVAAAVHSAIKEGDMARAKKLAVLLPPAPKCP